MTKKRYLICIMTLLFTGCAIRYKSQSALLLHEEPTDKNTPFLSISKKEDNKVISRNLRLKNYLRKKGYKSYIVSASNHTRDTVKFFEKNLYVIKDHQQIRYLKPEELIKVVKLNRGLFTAISGYSLISPFAYSGRKLSFGKSHLFIALPILAYSTTNALIAYSSVKGFKKDIKEYYLMGKILLPGQTTSGIVVVKTSGDDFDFIYKADN